MKILGIMGSPRLKGNTDLLLDETLKGAQNAGAAIEKIIVSKLNIAPCKEYNTCIRDGKCAIRDEMNDIYPKLLEADAIIVASPIFFYGVTSQLKALIDRCQALWARKYILKQTLSYPGRKGAFLAVGATSGEKLFDGCLLTMKYFFQAVDVDYTDNLLIRGIDKKGEITEHPTALPDAFELGKKLAQQ